ncbi:hypothetical protein KKA09_04145 [Patescibacteria group bacterium]|nr:hypothetical protein [Patescibacteria group bacterium]
MKPIKKDYVGEKGGTGGFNLNDRRYCSPDNVVVFGRNKSVIITIEHKGRTESFELKYSKVAEIIRILLSTKELFLSSHKGGEREWLR